MCFYSHFIFSVTLQIFTRNSHFQWIYSIPVCAVDNTIRQGHNYSLIYLTKSTIETKQQGVKSDDAEGALIISQYVYRRRIHCKMVLNCLPYFSDNHDDIWRWYDCVLKKKLRLRTFHTYPYPLIWQWGNNGMLIPFLPGYNSISGRKW